MDHLLSKKEAAKFLGFSVRTLDRRVAAGHLPYVSDHPGARVRFRPEDLNRYVKNTLHRTREG